MFMSAQSDFNRWIGQLALIVLIGLACVTACRAMIIPPGATGGCCCAACLSAAQNNTPTHPERLTRAVAQLDGVDREMRTRPRYARFLPLMATEHGMILQQVEKARTLFSTVQDVNTVEAAVSTVEAAARHYALWPIRAEIVTAASAAHRPEPTWGVLSGSEFMRAAEYNILPEYAEPRIVLAGMRGEQVSAQLLLFPFDQALTIPYRADNAESCLRIDALADGAGHRIAPSQWTVMTVIPWWRCVEGHPMPGSSPLMVWNFPMPYIH